MSAYRALLSAQLRTLLQYRAAALAGLTAQLFFGFVIVMVYEAFYASASAPMPMTLREVTTYTWLGQAMLGLMPWYIDPEIRERIRTGGVAYELLRPADLYNMWFIRSVARRAAPTLLRSLPIFVVAGLFLGLEPPPTAAAGLAWAAATFCALLLASAITTLMAVTLMWTISGEGILYIMPGIAGFFSGQYLPLPLMPDWIELLSEWLPFRGLIDIPFRLYLGRVPVEECLPLFLHQLAWIAVLVLAGRRALARGTRRLVVQGG